VETPMTGLSLFQIRYRSLYDSENKPCKIAPPHEKPATKIPHQKFMRD